MPLLLLLLILAPIAEIVVFIEVGRWIGAGWTIIGILATAVIGAVLLRRQGMQTMREAVETMRRDEVPVKQLFDGMCIFMGGLLLLMPGFITDLLGALLLVPPLRAVIGRRLWDTLQRNGSIVVRGGPRPGAPGRRGPGTEAHGPVVIDAEYREVGPDEQDPKGSAPPLRESRWRPDTDR